MHSLSKFSLLLLSAKFFVFSSSLGQSLGDYQSRGTGDWSQNTTWEIYTVTGWASSPTIPGSTSNVSIVDDDEVTVNGNYSCASLTVTAPAGSNGTTTLTVSSGYTLTVSGNVLISGGNNNNRIGNITLAGTGTLDIGGNLTLNAGNSVRAVLNMSNGNSTVKLGGSFTNNGTLTTNGGGSNTFEFKSNLVQIIPAGSYCNLTSSGLGVRTLSGVIKVAGTLNSGTNTYTTTGSTIEFNGSSAQTFSGNLGSLSSPFNNVIINNSGFGVQLTSATYVSGTLTLTAGKLYLNQQTLTLNNPAITAITRTSGYIVSEDNSVDGSGKANNSSRIAWAIGTVNGAHVFPFGKPSTGAYIPFTFNLVSGDAGTVTVSTYPTTSPLITPYPASVTHINDLNGADNSSYMVGRFWQINKTGITCSADITFTFSTGEDPVDAVGGTITNIRAQRWNGNGWDIPPVGQASASRSVTVPGVTQFSPWALVKSISPLPVDLLYFKAGISEEKNKVNLSWATAVETNNEAFYVEKSTDGKEFRRILEVPGQGTKGFLSEYQAEDELTSDYPVIYYRLRQKDFDGAEEIISLTELKLPQTVFSDVQVRKLADDRIALSFKSSGEQPYKLKVMDLLGNEVSYSEGLTLQGENQYFLTNSNFSYRILIIQFTSPLQNIFLKVAN